MFGGFDYYLYLCVIKDDKRQESPDLDLCIT